MGQPHDPLVHFRYARPPISHWRKAPCKEVECDGYKYGWITAVPVGSDLEDLVRHHKTARFWKEERRDGGLVCFWFSPGQTCFNAHKSDHYVSNGAPPLYIRKTDGDSKVIEHERWEDELHHGLDRVEKIYQRGG